MRDDHKVQICYHVDMLQKRRVFDLTNSIMNYLFWVFLLLCGIYFASYWFELKLSFLDYLVNTINIAAWLLSGVSVVLLVLALLLAIADKDLKLFSILWCLLRMVICVVLSVLVDLSLIMTSGGVSVNL
ncbi:MAG TPA: hypothetical protein DCP98_05915 [Sphaerochaeta sp.]|nr:hypothetical protein [Sphaerochaeta sp.]